MHAAIGKPKIDAYLPTAQDAIGDIAVKLPGATAIFRRLKLDFCCGGQTSLDQAATGKGLDPQQVLAELTTLQRPNEAKKFENPAELIEHILVRYHEVHRHQFPELIRMARRVEAVHKDHPSVPAGLTDLLEGMQEELLSHMQKEEAILFPMLGAGGNSFVGQPIAMMRREHSDHGLQLERLVSLTNEMQAPTGACNTWLALYAGISQFNEDLINHIHLENNFLFPIFDGSLK